MELAFADLFSYERLRIDDQPHVDIETMRIVDIATEDDEINPYGSYRWILFATAGDDADVARVLAFLRHTNAYWRRAEEFRAHACDEYDEGVGECSRCCTGCHDELYEFYINSRRGHPYISTVMSRPVRSTGDLRRTEVELDAFFASDGETVDTSYMFLLFRRGVPHVGFYYYAEYWSLAAPWTVCEFRDFDESATMTMTVKDLSASLRHVLRHRRRWSR